MRTRAQVIEGAAEEKGLGFSPAQYVLARMCRKKKVVVFLAGGCTDWRWNRLDGECSGLVVREEERRTEEPRCRCHYIYIGDDANSLARGVYCCKQSKFSFCWWLPLFAVVLKTREIET